MKVALVNPFSFSYQGGVQEHVKALYRVLRSKGCQVKVIAPRQHREENYGADFLLLGSSIVIPGNDSRISLSYCFPHEVEEVLERERFDVFHFHSFLPFISFQILDAIKDPQAVKILTSHSNMEGTFFAMALGAVTSSVVDSFVTRMDGVICVSKAAAKLVKSFKGERVVIPNGIDLTRFHPEVEKVKGFSDGKVNILFVGRLDRRKGLQVLLPTFALLKKNYENVRLIVVGDGFLRDELYRQTVREKIKDVVFVGEVKAEDAPRYYAAADIFCAPSIRGETFGIILLEAMATGLPVIASNIEGYREVMPEGLAPLLVEPDRPDSLFKVLAMLVEGAEIRKSYGKVGLEHAKNYDWNVVGEKVYRFYKEMLTARSGRVTR